MAISRTAKGTASDKSSSLTLTISSVQVARRLLVVGISYEPGSGSPKIKWGNHLLTPIETVTGNGITTRIVAYRRRRDAKTKNIVATWPTSAPTAKAMWASTYSEVGTLDLDSSLSQAATASPNSGAAATTTVAKEVFIGAMGSEGPSSDAAGSPSDGYTAGQRVGTTGAPPVSNITCQEIYKIVTAIESTQAALTSVTSRGWSSVLTTWKGGVNEEFNTTQYDYDEIEDVANSNDLDVKDMFVDYNILLGQNEMFHIDPDNGIRTLKATWKPNTVGGWVIL